MFDLIRSLNLRHLRGQWLRAGLSLIGVVMGVSTFVFAPSLAVNISASLAATSSDLSGRATLEIRAEQGGLSPQALDIARADAGVALAAPLMTGGGLLLGQPELLAFVGVDATLDDQVRAYTLADGAFLAADGEALLTARYAAEKGLGVGDTVTLVSAGGLRPLRVAGLLAAGDGIARLNSGDVLLMGLTDAAALRGSDAPDAISLIPVEGADREALIARLNAALPAGARVGEPADRFASAREFNIVTTFIIGSVSALILGFGATLITNTMTVSVAQRRAEIGVLRALGARRGDLVRLFTLEAGALGLIGSLLGVAFGMLLVRVGGDIAVIPDDFIGTSGIHSKAALTVPTWLPPLALLCGVAISALAGYWPSRIVARIDPVEAMIQSRAETGSVRAQPVRTALALLLVAGLIALRLFADRLPSDLGFIVGFNGFFLMLGVLWMLYTPVIVALGRGLPGALERAFGVAGRLAGDNLTRRPRRMLATGTLLTMSVMIALYIGASNFGYSEFVNAWDQGENLGDLTLVGAGTTPFAPLMPLPDGLDAALRARPDVAATIAERTGRAALDGQNYHIRALDFATFRAQGGRLTWDRGDEAAAYARLLDPAQRVVVLHTGAALLARGLGPGATLALPTPDGATLDFEVLGTTLGGVNTEAIVALMNRETYIAIWGDAAVDRLAVVLTPDADANAVRRELVRQFAAQGVVVLDNAELRAAFAGRLTSISSVSSLLSSLFALIIMAGLASTFYVVVLDRRREIGTLRALGLRRGQVVRALLIEALALCAVAMILGVPGAYLANAMQQISTQAIIGVAFAFNAREVLLTLVVVLLAVLAAVIVPARHAARTDVLLAMRAE